MAAQNINYADIARQHGGVPVSEEMPPELGRIRDAIGVQYKVGNSDPNAIASVGEHEPHVVEIDNVDKYKQGPAQVQSHELTHIWQNNLPGKIQSAIPPDNPKAPYDISNIDELRKQGKKLYNLPHEQAAAIVQRYVADPSSRARLKPWIEDLGTTPLSIMEMTSPQDKTINRNVRPPLPPPPGSTKS